MKTAKKPTMAKLKLNDPTRIAGIRVVELSTQAARFTKKAAQVALVEHKTLLVARDGYLVRIDAENKVVNRIKPLGSSVKQL